MVFDLRTSAEAVMRSLQQLAEAWLDAHLRGREALLRGDDVDAQIAGVVPLLTTREPWRASALADARLFVRTFVPFGSGLHVVARPTDAYEAFEPWSRAVHPFEYVLRHSATMDAPRFEETSMRIDRIAEEGGEWRVVSIFDAAGRARAEMEAQLLDRARAARDGR